VPYSRNLNLQQNILGLENASGAWMAIKLKFRGSSLPSSSGNWLPPKSVLIMIYLSEPLVHSWWRHKALGGLSQIPALRYPAVGPLTCYMSLANEKPFSYRLRNINTPHYIHTTFRKLPLSSRGEHCIVYRFKKNTVTHSWFQTFVVLYSLIWAFPWCLNFMCRRFGTLCKFHLHRWCGHTTYEDGTEYSNMSTQNSDAGESPRKRQQKLLIVCNWKG
jgi:hypothetical protein